MPIPNRICESISTNFIEGLPKSHGKQVNFVVVDRLSNYAHFLALSHPYAAIDVAQFFMDSVCKLHGMPNSITSDRDPILLSKVWTEFCSLQGVSLNRSTAYHPQSYGHTEIVKKALKTYFRCMCSEHASEWYHCHWLDGGVIP